jgi:hypothetical protein
MNMLTLGPGATLIRRDSHFRDADSPVEQNVADRAIAFLFEPVALHPELKLGDIFILFEACPALHQVFRRAWSVEMCEEARKGAVPQRRGDNPADDAGIEYLELYWSWARDTASSTYRSVHRLDLHGVGPVLASDNAIYGHRAGTRINWSVSLTPLRELLELPLRLREELSIAEDDIDAKAYAQPIASGRCDEVLLGQVIQGVLWELSFYGGPEDKAQVGADLKAQVEEIDAGTAELTSGDDFFDELDRPGFDALFETLGDVRLRAVRHAMRQLEDDEAAGPALSRAFDGKVVVRRPFRTLSGREFRRAFRAASSAARD